MYRQKNKQILEEISRLETLKRGVVVGRSETPVTTVTSLGKFYSKTEDSELYIALKEYSEPEISLRIQIAFELGLIDLVGERLPRIVSEFPLFHGLFTDPDGKPIGVIAEDFSKNRSIPVKYCADWPFEVRNVIGLPKDPEHLRSTSFLVDGIRRIGDFGDFRPLSHTLYLEIAGDYADNLDDFSVKIPLQ
ncbi:hypothetical protein GOV12_07395 [Candidatus Pacearchaeota archaeon]|nr:hypothetical protein [Candidatus Pacearchaeota archaeon]